jgi:hypothetical protein
MSDTPAIQRVMDFDIWNTFEYTSGRYRGWGMPFIIHHKEKKRYYVIQGIKRFERATRPFIFNADKNYNLIAGPFTTFEAACVAYKLAHPGPQK